MKIINISGFSYRHICLYLTITQRFERATLACVLKNTRFKLYCWHSRPRKPGAAQCAAPFFVLSGYGLGRTAMSGQP